MIRVLITMAFIYQTGYSFAQVADGLTPLQRKQLTVLSEPATLYKGFLRIGYGIKYSRHGRSFDSNGINRTPEGFNYAGNYVDHLVSISYGIIDRVQFSVTLPYVSKDIRALVKLNQSGNQQVAAKIDINSRGISDLQTELRFQVLKETAKLPSLVVGLGAWLPTGSNKRTILTDPITANTQYKDITGGVGSSVLATLQVRKVIYPYLFAAELVYFFGSDGEIIENNQTIDVIGANSAIWQFTTGMHLNEWITLTGKVFYQRLSFDSKVDSNTSSQLLDNSRKELLTLTQHLHFNLVVFDASK